MAELYSPTVIAQLSNDMVGTRVTICTTTLIIYEYLVTVDSEVRLFWGKQITGASILFFVNRYMMFFYVLFFLWTYSPLTGTGSAYVHYPRSNRLTSSNDADRCEPYGYTVYSWKYLNYIPWAGFSALRVFALTGRNWFLAAVVFILSLGPVISSFVLLHWTVIGIFPVYGCLERMIFPESVFTGRGTVTVADLIAIIVTWCTTYKTAAISRGVLNHNGPTFSGLLLRDGTLYFIVILSINVLQMAFSLSTVLMALVYGGLGYMTQFGEPLTSILISRFMINLQEARRVASGSTGVGQTVSLVRFDRVVGSLSELLEPRIVEAIVDDDEATE